MTVNLVQDITTVLDADESALNAEKATIEAQIAALQTQLAEIEQQRTDIARFRTLVADIQSGAIYGAVYVPASPSLSPSTATPVQPGITTN